MIFAAFRTVAKLAIVSTTFAGLVVGAPAPSRADANLPPILVRHEETILIPVPDCSKSLPVFPGHCPDERVFAADCVCAE